ncbi:MAG TPA: HEAT repeat domain-containing protein [Gemmataceae bacterium]|nr:HEAT repeat domain-containing protein [Gemmataceae bacterium]
MKPIHLFTLLALGVGLAWQPATAHAQEFLGKKLDEWAENLAPAKTDPQRRAAAFALGKLIKGAVDSLPARDRKPNSARMKEIGQWAGMALNALGPRLGDTDAEVREAVAFSIGEICGAARVFSPDLLKGLTTLLKADPDPLVRRSAAFALGSIRKADQPVLDALAAKLKDNDPAVRQNVAWALGRLGDKAAPALKQALKDGDPLVRRDAAKALDELSEDAAYQAIPELLACCGNKDIEERKAAYASLVRLLGPPDDPEDAKEAMLRKDAKAMMLKGLSDPEIEIRRNAALGFAGLGGPDAVPAIPVLLDILRLKSNDPNILNLRRSAALAFGSIGPAAKDAVPDLRTALSDPDEEIRHNAAVSCIGLKKEAESLLPDLVKLLTNRKESDRVREQAAVAISRLGYGPGLEKVMPDILRLAADTSEKSKVRERALWPVRPYLNNSDKRDPVYKTLLPILDEPRAVETKMLRYDSAYLLGMFQTRDAPEKVLDVLEAFLMDPDIKIYGGRTGVLAGTTEGKTGASSGKETGKDDGRIMAVDALTRIGAQRVNQRPAIVAQLRALDGQIDPATAPDFSKKIKKLLNDLKK